MEERLLPRPNAHVGSQAAFDGRSPPQAIHPRVTAHRLDGLRDVFAESGEAELLFDHFGMGVPHVCEAVKQLVTRKPDALNPQAR